MTDYDRNSPLTIEQQQRTAALSQANSLLSAYQKPAAPDALLVMAEWIVDGPARNTTSDLLQTLCAPITAARDGEAG